MLRRRARLALLQHSHFPCREQIWRITLLEHLCTFEQLLGLLPLCFKITFAFLLGDCLLGPQNRAIDDVLVHLFNMMEALFARRPAAHCFWRSLLP